jgi:hypothetical protein
MPRREEKRREAHKMQETAKIEKTHKKYTERDTRVNENAKRIKEKIKHTQEKKEHWRERVS